MRHGAPPRSAAQVPRRLDTARESCYESAMTIILLAIIGALLLLNAWQCWTHEQAMERAQERWSVAPPVRVSRPPTEPIPLLVPARAGWGTLLDDIAPTRVFGRLPSFTIQEFGGAMGCPLDIEKDRW